MSYNTIAKCVNDVPFNDRVRSCIAQEQKAKEEMINPNIYHYSMVWALSVVADIEAAYASALAGANPNPGGDESVITDGMILSNVQANWPEPPPIINPESPKVHTVDDHQIQSAPPTPEIVSGKQSQP